MSTDLMDADAVIQAAAGTDSPPSTDEVAQTTSCDQTTQESLTERDETTATANGGGVEDICSEIETKTLQITYSQVNETETAKPVTETSEPGTEILEQEGNIATTEVHVNDETENSSLVGAEDGMFDDVSDDADDDAHESDSNQAPALPEKRPLLSSLERLSASVSHDSSSSSNSSLDGAQNDDVVTIQPIMHPATSTSSHDVTAGNPPLSADDVTLGLPVSPNEPPPPYAPRSGGNPYDGTPGDDRITSDDRVVIVQRQGVVGNCPKCQTGNIIKNFSFCGICLGIWLFPCGLICLFCMREKKCSHCNERV